MAQNDGLDATTDSQAIHREFGVDGEFIDVEREKVTISVNEPYDPDRIDVATRTPTINLMLSRILRGKIDLQPDFQRNAGIWNGANQSRLIESMLLRIPLPAFYAAENPDDSWAIVDGIQRLTAIARFMAPDSVSFPPLKLKGLNYLDFDGCRFEDLPGHLQTRLEETEIVLHLIRAGTPENAKFNIFARINTGGLPLTTQELRHALIPGVARRILAELAQNAEFQAATSNSVAGSRMADREMALRFIAFLMVDPEKYLERDFDSFLRESMKEINSLDTETLSDIQSRFSKAMRAAQDIFGIYAFRKQYQQEAGRFPINKALFEVIGVSLARRTGQQIDRLIEKRLQVSSGFIDLMNSDVRFDQAISVGTGDPAKVRYRFKAIDELLAKYDRS